jgi:uncharacterized membrane protein YfcA
MLPLAYLAAVSALALGAALQGAVGFGCNLVAAPLLALIDPTLIPGSLIAANLTLNLAMLVRERPEGAWALARWPIIGQVPGTVAGAVVLGAAATGNVTVFFAVLTLAAVALSVRRAPVPRTPVTLTMAGVLSGFMGTAAGIGGPPVALVLQDTSPVRFRATINRIFLVSSLCSVVGLAAVGLFDLTTVARGLLLVPGIAIGFAVSGPMLGRIQPHHLRRAVLLVSTASALVALARGLR